MKKSFITFGPDLGLDCMLRPICPYTKKFCGTLWMDGWLAILHPFQQYFSYIRAIVG